MATPERGYPAPNRMLAKRGGRGVTGIFITSRQRRKGRRPLGPLLGQAARGLLAVALEAERHAYLERYAVAVDEEGCAHRGMRRT